MIRIPRIKFATQTAKVDQSYELSGKVTVGAESAARLSKKLKREVKVGEVFDLGTLAAYDSRWTLWQTFKNTFKLAFKRHEFS